jgi:hypothetical protein
MKRISILPVLLLFFSAGVVKSQAPMGGTIVTDLEALVTANKAILDKQQKTLDGLDKMDQDAQQLKMFVKRS